MSGLTKGSRFWLVTPWFVLISVVAAFYFKDASVFKDITMVWLGLAGAKSTAGTWKKSNPGEQ